MNQLRRARARTRRAGTAAVVLTASLAVGQVAPASGDDGRHAVHFTLANSATAASAGQVFPSDFSRCHLNADGTFDPCVVPATALAGFDGTITGDLQGTQTTKDEAELGVLVAGDASGVDWPVIDIERFAVTVTGCGTGSFVLRRDGNNGSPDSTWTIVPHTGRGGLLGLSGSGTATGAFSGPGGTFVDTFTGRIRCDDHER